MNSKDFLKEGFIEDASDVHMDHEVQMAREECYHAAEHALAIHKLLRNISEQQGLEGWVSSKITLANDYLNTVREHLEYELLQPQIDDVVIGMPIAENQRLDELNPVAAGAAAGSALGAAAIAGLRKLDQKRKEQQAQTQSKQDKDSNEKLERERERKLQQNLHQHQLLNQPVNEQGVKGPRRSGASLGSNHIGGRSDAQSGKRSQTRGLGSSPTGKLLVAKEDMNAWKKQQRALMRETSAGSVAGVINPKSKKPKSQVGSLFGGTYKQPQKKA